MKVNKKRADELLAWAGLATSRSQAQALIMAGEVMVGERPVKKAGELWPEETCFSLKPRPRYVSRGGLKLEGALADLNFDPTGLAALDIGASTGGFTDCLLQHGAATVTAVDVGRNLIDAKLRSDPRVTVIEELNARRLAESLPNQAFDLAVIDVSFISLELILPQAVQLLKPEGHLMAMVKPQFEVGRDKVGKNGVVRNPDHILAAVDKVSALGPSLHPPFVEKARAASRWLGPAGNQEVFLLFVSALAGGVI